MIDCVLTMQEVALVAQRTQPGSCSGEAEVLWAVLLDSGAV